MAGSVSSLPASLAAAVAAASASAQQYPSKPVRIIVAAAPGGGTDFMARLVGQRLGETLGQQVIVDNRPGAGSTLGFELGVRSPPDGYTLNMITPSWSINPALYPLKFDPANDYTPILIVARGPFVIVVHPSLPARTTRELVALAKAMRGQITTAAADSAFVHIATESFATEGIRDPRAVQGGGPALTDLIVQSTRVRDAASGSPQVKAKRVVRSPDHTRRGTPPGTSDGRGIRVPGYEVTNWHG